MSDVTLDPVDRIGRRYRTMKGGGLVVEISDYDPDDDSYLLVSGVTTRVISRDLLEAEIESGGVCPV